MAVITQPSPKALLAPDAVGPPRIVLCGNPNVGKSALFRQLTGRPAEECNVPGSSVLIAEAPLRASSGLWEAAAGALAVAPTTLTPRLVDTPGASSIFAIGEDELELRHLLLSRGPQTLLFVADAKNLRRSLAFFLQLLSFRLPMVVDVNMIDEAENLGLEVSVDKLGALLGCPVNASVAPEGHGIRALLETLPHASLPTLQVRYPALLEDALESLERLLPRASLPTRALGLLALADEEIAYSLIEEEFGPGTKDAVRALAATARAKLAAPVDIVLTEHLFALADRLLTPLLHRRSTTAPWTLKLGRLAQDPLWGVPLALLVSAAMYLWVGELGASRLVDALRTYVFEGFLVPMIEPTLQRLPWPVVYELLMDANFGLLPSGLFLAFGLVLPVLFFFFLFFAVLEDSGYLPRLSILLDRVLRRVGLNGRGVLPLVMGFSCVTMAVITTRMLETKKERLIATFLLVLGIPCAPLLSVQILVLSELKVTAALTLYGLLLLQLMVAGALLHRLMGGALPDFIMEIPRMRVPRARIILEKTIRRTVQFMNEAVPVFLLASLAMFVLHRAGGLTLLKEVAHPVVHGLLGLPDQALEMFIKTVIRRENGAAELYRIRESFDGVQRVICLLFMSLFMPCLNAILVIAKEHGARFALLLVLFVMGWCLLEVSALNALLRLLGATFMGG